MTILLIILFGAAVFWVVLAVLSSYTRRGNVALEPPKSTEPTEWMQYGETSHRPATTQETAVVPQDIIGFAAREIHMPALPKLCTQRPFESALPMPYPALEPVPAGQQLKAFAA